ncbi:MAG TPA: hypothetical protein VK959_04225 [Methylophilaceae bacterium]|nr:hypothetical protein [Methylophilaceae bacterium]
MNRASVLFLLLALTGCDKLTGAADQKIADAEAIGFACRVSQKTPEACMKENEAQSPSSILDGWKSADEDIKAGKLDPTMSGMSSNSSAEGETAAPAEGADAAAAAPPAEEKKDNAAKPEEAPKDEDKGKH